MLPHGSTLSLRTASAGKDKLTHRLTHFCAPASHRARSTSTPPQGTNKTPQDPRDAHFPYQAANSDRNYHLRPSRLIKQAPKNNRKIKEKSKRTVFVAFILLRRREPFFDSARRRKRRPRYPRLEAASPPAAVLPPATASPSAVPLRSSPAPHAQRHRTPPAAAALGALVTTP